MADHDDKPRKDDGQWASRRTPPLNEGRLSRLDEASSGPAAGFRQADRYDDHFGGFGVFATDDILERLARGEERRFWNRSREYVGTGGKHRGHGPKAYVRSDTRIYDDVNDRLTDDSWLDARQIKVGVKSAEVTLDGHVRSRDDKRRAEVLAESVSGVVHVQNNLRVKHHAADDEADAAPLPLI